MKKKYNRISLYLFLLLLGNVYTIQAQQQTCEDFNNGSFGSWLPYNATIGIFDETPTDDGSYYLQGKASQTNAWMYNTSSAYSGDLTQNGNSLCWDFKVLEGTTATVIPEIRIYSGGTAANPSSFATFRATAVPVTVNSDWVHICAPIVTCSSGSLPSNAQGSWEMSGSCSNWNSLIANATGIAFEINVTSNEFNTIGVDNICLETDCSEPDASFDIDISCDNGNKCVTVTSNNPDAPNHWWGLMEIDDYNSPNDTSDGNTVDADGDPSNGITPVSLITGQGSATFCWLNLGKRYYIKHIISEPNCYEGVEERTRVPNFIAAAIFNFENENGIPQTSFCYGEDVYMDGSLSFGENRYYIDAWRRPIGSTQDFNWYAGLGWTTNDQVGVLNLSERFSDLNPSKVFEPGYEYEIKLAIANLENCVGWTPTTRTFTVECCDDFLSAKFDSSQDTFGNIEILGFDLYSNIDATHEWFVMSSPNQTGGPYTPVLSTTSSGPAPFTLTFDSQPGLFYTVIHRVKTLCGEVCSTNVHYFVQGVVESVPVVDQDIENGCSLIDEVFPKCEELATPTNLQVNGTTLSWDPVPGATSYIISSPAWNDPQVACKCRNLASIYITTDQTSHTISNSLASKCFIWQVTAVCEDETQSQASQQMCFYPVFVTPDEPSDGEVAQVAVSPNPNNGEFTINIDVSYDSNISVEVYDFYGQVVKTFTDTAKAGNSKSINWNGAGTLRQGIYILEIKTDREVIYKKMIVK